MHQKRFSFASTRKRKRPTFFCIQSFVSPIHSRRPFSAHVRREGGKGFHFHRCRKDKRERSKDPENCYFPSPLICCSSQHHPFDQFLLDWPFFQDGGGGEQGDTSFIFSFLSLRNAKRELFSRVGLAQPFCRYR